MKILQTLHYYAAQEALEKREVKQLTEISRKQMSFKVGFECREIDR